MDKIFYLKLLELEGIGNKSALYIRKFFLKNNIDYQNLSERDIIDIFKEIKNNNGKIRIPSEDELKESLKKAHEIIKTSKENNVEIITIDDDYYPDEFKKIFNPPVLYYYKGNHDVIRHKEKIAIIGTRYPTLEGKKNAYRISEYFAKRNYVIVSGLAIGCDTCGHIAAVKNGGMTIGVLPSDLNNIYPYENKKLAEKIIEGRGCLISEYPLGSKLKDYKFIERDRLQAALAKVVIVIETGLKSGTMHTVGFTKKYKKFLACVDYPNIVKYKNKREGNKMILKDNDVIKIRSVSDLNRIEVIYSK